MSDQYVYFIQADENGPIKIGYTADDPKRRLNQLQTGNAATLRLLGAIKGTTTRERQFHSQLAEWRMQGEWFEAHPTVLAVIQDAMTAPPIAEESCDVMAPCRHCSFCFKCEDDLEILIAGPAANICEACVAVCVESVEAEKERRS